MDYLENKKSLHYIILGCIIFLTTLLYLPVLHNSFLHFDDDTYVVENEMIRDFSAKGIQQIFFAPDPSQTPRLTLFSFSLDYAIGELNPQVYHLHNLLLYLLGIIVLFFFVKKLLKRKDIALLVVLLYSFLATHVESVAWVSQRKDMLYFLFFFLALLFYLFYLENTKRKYLFLLLTFFFFACSFHSKVAAAPLPLVLFLIDYLKKRKFSWKLVLEKIPFILYLLYYLLDFSISTAAPQLNQESMQMQEVYYSFGIFYTFIDKIFLAAFSMLYYLKMFFYPHPVYLIHPYPEKMQGALPSEYYISAVLLLVIITLLIIIIRKLKTEQKSLWIFTLGFFLLNIGLYMHFISIKGIVVVADRYSLVAYVGLLILLASIIVGFAKSKVKKHRKIYFPLSLSLYLLLLFQHGISASNYVKVWKNDESLFSDLISKNNKVYQAYNNRGIYYYKNKEHLKAIDDFSQAIRINPYIHYIYNNRGITYLEIEKYNQALEDFQRSLEIKPDDNQSKINISKLYSLMNRNEESLQAFNEVLEKDANNFSALNDRGRILNELDKPLEALNDLNKAIAINPNFSFAYNNRGISYSKLGDYEKAMKDFEKAIATDPTYADPYMNKANILGMHNRFAEAIDYYDKAIALQIDNPYAYMNRAACYFELNNLEMACKDWKTAEQKGVVEAREIIQEHCN
jgi:tetratricopeptide (TPR) repeat protein